MAWYTPLLRDYTQRVASYTSHLKDSGFFFYLLWPIKGAVISQHFGNNPEYYGKWFHGKGHEGTDFAMPWHSLKKTEGQPVMAGAPGIVRVVDTTDDSNYGISVRIDHPEGFFESVYAHLKSVTVTPGQKVERGHVIGYAGNTGNSFGAHLHLTLKQKGNNSEGYGLDARGYGVVNPEKYLRKV